MCIVLRVYRLEYTKKPRVYSYIMSTCNLSSSVESGTGAPPESTESVADVLTVNRVIYSVYSTQSI